MESRKAQGVLGLKVYGISGFSSTSQIPTKSHNCPPFNHRFGVKGHHYWNMGGLGIGGPKVQDLAFRVREEIYRSPNQHGIRNL